MASEALSQLGGGGEGGEDAGNERKKFAHKNDTDTSLQSQTFVLLGVLPLPLKNKKKKKKGYWSGCVK